MRVNHCFLGDNRESMRQMLADGYDGKVQTIVTSPPYFGLRDYGHSKQLGLEETPQEYISNMVKVFRMARDLLAADGTLWLNIGDSYATGTTASRKQGKRGLGDATQVAQDAVPRIGNPDGCKTKDLIGIPWMLAFALRADGWYLRQDIIWNKPNPMPESVRDRCTKAHEYLFLLSKSERYYFDQDAIREPLKDASIARLIQDIEQQTGSARVPGKTNGNMKAVRKNYDKSMGGGGSKISGHSGYFADDGTPICGSTANKKSVWTIPTESYSGAHFATFPRALVEPCILAGSKPGQIVLDPFLGSGTVAQVAQDLGRHWLGCELNPEYIQLQHERTRQQGLMLELSA